MSGKPRSRPAESTGSGGDVGGLLTVSLAVLDNYDFALGISHLVTCSVGFVNHQR